MRKVWLWLAGAFVLLLVAVVGIAFFIDEPLRGYIERTMNEHLQGYTIRIGALDVHPFRLSVDVKDVSISQDANPDPPIVHIPRLSAGVQWRELLSAHIVGDVLVERPTAHINLKQVRSEAADEVPIEKRGWQEAVEAVAPIKLNKLQVVDGDITYIDEGPFRPLHITQLQVRAENIRNIRSPEHVYPSNLHLEGTVFDTGKILLDGQANFLAEPHVGVQGQLTLEQIDLDYFKPITNRYNVAVRGGTFSAACTIEYAPGTQVVHVQHATIQGMQLDYVHKAQTAVAEKQAAKKVARTAQEVNNAPGMLLRADQLSIVKSTMGFVNKATKPDYRVFIEVNEFGLTNFSNHFTEGPATGKLTGKFMGSGKTVVTSTFRPEKAGPDFDLAVRIEDTQMRSMNDLFRAYGNFDVVTGFFSFFMELTVKKGNVTGYVKPLFRDMDVYDKRQDREKDLFRKIYEGIIGSIADLLENAPREEVATKTEIHGKIANPQTDTGEVIVRLVQNAFFRAILPGFEKEVGRLPHSTRR
jgi:hypothetical protein